MPSKNALPGRQPHSRYKAANRRHAYKTDFPAVPMPVNQKATAAQQSRTGQPPQDKTMKKLILCLTAAAATSAAATSAAASDEGRIAALEARIAVLERNGNTAYRRTVRFTYAALPPSEKPSKPPTTTKAWHAAKSAAPAMPKPRPCSAKTATSAANASIKRLRACSGRLRSVKIQAV